MADMEKRKKEFISKKDINNIICVIIFCTVPIVLLIATMLIMYTIYNIFNIYSFWGEVLTVQSIPSLISMGIVPWIMYSKMTKKSIKDIMYLKKQLIISRAISVIMLFGFLIMLLIFREHVKLISPFVIHFLVIAIVEEVLIRGIITDRLKEVFINEWLAILISALIFSFVFHSRNGFVNGLIYHVPFALLMSLIYKKTGALEVPIMIHWIYNVVLTIAEVMY